MRHNIFGYIVVNEKNDAGLFLHRFSTAARLGNQERTISLPH